MKMVCLLLCLALSASAAPAGAAGAAEGGIATIVDGNVTLLRGASWYKLAEGVRIQDGDVVDLPDKGSVQLELLDGSSLAVQGPASVYAVSLPARDGKGTGGAEFYLSRGWIKLGVHGAKNGVRVRTPLAGLTLTDGVVVMRSGDGADVFVETGGARLTDPGRKPTEATPVAKAGEFWSKPGAGKSFTTAPRAPATFVTAMPQHFMVTMPNRMAKFQSRRVDPILLREATFADAEPWLATPYKSAFVSRLQARLKEDPAFQKAAEARTREGVETDKTTRVEPGKKVEPPAAAPPPAPAKGLWERLFERGK